MSATGCRRLCRRWGLSPRPKRCPLALQFDHGGRDGRPRGADRASSRGWPMRVLRQARAAGTHQLSLTLRSRDRLRRVPRRLPSWKRRGSQGCSGAFPSSLTEARSRYQAFELHGPPIPPGKGCLGTSVQRVSATLAAVNRLAALSGVDPVGLVRRPRQDPGAARRDL